MLGRTVLVALLLGGYLAGTLVRSPVVRFTLDVLVIGLVLVAVHRGEGVPRWLRWLSTTAAEASRGSYSPSRRRLFTPRYSRRMEPTASRYS